MKNDGESPGTTPNPLQILNNLQNGTVYELVSKRGTPHNPIFIMRVTVNGYIFTGQGSSKKMARYAAASAALSSLKNGPPPVKKGPPQLPNTKISKVKLRNGNTVNVVPKNPLALLNEIQKGVVYDLVSKTGTPHNPEFVFRIAIFDRFYIGKGSSIRIARQQAAVAALVNLIELRNEVIQFLVERDSAKQQDDLITAIHLSLDTLNYEPIVPDVNPTLIINNNPPVIDPISLLFKIFPNTHFDCTVRRESNNPLTFYMYVRVNGTPFEGRGKSKKSAKLAAAKTALATLCHMSFNTPAAADLPQAFADQMGQLITDKYNQIMAGDLENVMKRRILAGFVITRNSNYSKPEVISLATGNRCITGEYMSRFGAALNDSHAEILSRRSLIHYLYTQLEYYTKPLADDNLSIFERPSVPGELYKLKDGIRFHLYISISPCGDARVFGPHEQNQNASSSSDQRDNGRRGLLRTKIEAGEGTIPISSRNGIQTWDGILSGEKLVTMSCSDKICRWNVLGLQGALLSNIIEPIYLDSLVLGSIFDPDHVYRAIYGRIEDSIENLPPAFRLNKPKLALVSSVEERNLAKTTHLSTIWTFGNEEVETINSTIGVTLKQCPSRICKYAFFERYSALIQKIAKDDDDIKLAETYEETKNLATHFQAAKRELFEAFRRKHLGSWLKKPIEQDQFGL